MKIELSAFKSRIAKRLFSLFLVVIFFPLLITGILSYHEVSQLISYEHKESLRRTSQEYGLGLFDRLSNARRYLGIASTDLGDDTPLNDDEWLLLKEYFDQLLIFRDNQHTHSLLSTGADGALIQQLKNIDNERILLINNGSEKDVWLINKRQDKSHSYITLGKVKPDYAWPDTELGAYESLCIATKSGEVVHCTEPMPSEKIKALIRQPNTLALSWTNSDDDEMLASYWALFMAYQFQVSDWYIITSKPESIVHAKLMAFARTYIPGTLLALLLIILLSVISIKRYLKPVEALIKGTNALAANDFSYRIDLQTNDEYQELAESFNSTAGKLNNQFNLNAALSAIDRKLLLQTDIHECVDEILKGLSHLSQPQNGCVFIFDSLLQPDQIVYHYDYMKKECSKIPTDIELLLNQVNTYLAENALYCSADKVKEWFPDASWPNSSTHYRFYPLHHDGQLMAALLIGNQEAVYHPRFSEFLRHTAVVFNALHREKQLERQANFDKLTGLYNRSYFQFKADQILQDSCPTTYQTAMLFIDLDRFKNVNDTLGHHVGDLLLIEAAQRIIKSLPDSAIASRFGGDEFTIFVPNLNKLELSTLSEVIIQSLSEIYNIDNYHASISASIGISQFPDHADTFDSLLKCADIAMYKAKEKGRECYEFYSTELSIILERRTFLESYIKDAVEKGMMSVVYQPKIDIQNQCFSGFEALSRFTHPTADFIPPDELFSIAEETGMVMELGYYAMITAMKQQVLWEKDGIWQGRMAINISPIQLFDPNFTAQLEQAIDHSGANPKHIELEITEGVFIDNLQKATELLSHIRSKGFTIGIDDFGTGYSSFSYITSLPIDNLKIDRSFITQLGTNEKYKGVISSIILMAKHLNLKVTAEGVETESDLSFMLDHQCDDIQGYLYSKPLSTESATAILKKPQIERLFKHIAR